MVGMLFVLIWHGLGTYRGFRQGGLLLLVLYSKGKGGEAGVCLGLGDAVFLIDGWRTIGGESSVWPFVRRLVDIGIPRSIERERERAGIHVECSYLLSFFSPKEQERGDIKR